VATSREEVFFVLIENYIHKVCPERREYKDIDSRVCWNRASVKDLALGNMFLASMER
jgi:hypothetical protein